MSLELSQMSSRLIADEFTDHNASFISLVLTRDDFIEMTVSTWIDLNTIFSP